MPDKASLEAMKLAELKDLAKKLSIKKTETLKKSDLIARILETQGAGKAALSAIRTPSPPWPLPMRSNPWKIRNPKK
jgi:hypothetical protein